MEDLMEKMKEEKPNCPKCGQTDSGQTGEYPCPECGLPTVWDKPKLTPKDRAKAYRLTKMAEDPDWDKKRMKKWRTEHKESYHYGQAKYHFNKLTSEQKKRLLDEAIPV